VTKKQTRKKQSAVGLHRQVRHALVPHKDNHYRPHLVRLHGLTAVLVLALLMQLVYGFISSGRIEVLGRVSDISVSELLTDTNEARANASMPGLKINDRLNQAAFLKAQDMFTHNYWAHVSPSGVTPWQWLAETGYNYDVAGENLAKNYPSARATVDAWMNSESHRANILNERYQEIGFAVVDGLLEGRDTTLVVAFYGTPASAAVEGAGNRATYAAPVNENGLNPLAFFGTALQSLSPATLGALALLTVVGAVALAAHHYRHKLPVAWRRSWKRHHGLYTLISVIGFGLVMIVATGGGQI
jgi:hypothetical protein